MAHSSTAARLEILVSTCNERIVEVPRLVLPPLPGVGWLVVHQLFGAAGDGAGDPAVDRLEARKDVRIVRTCTRGLAVSRNVALDHARGELLLIADDDVRYTAAGLERVRAAFAEDERFALLTFRIATPDGGSFRRYPAQRYEHDRVTAFRVASIEIALRRAAIEAAGLRFDERFGLGAEHPSCEETVFVTDALGAGLRAGFVPEVIVEHPAESSGANWGAPEAARMRGPLFRRIFGWKGLPLLLVFALRQWGNFRGHLSLAEFLGRALPAYFRFEREPGRRAAPGAYRD